MLCIITDVIHKVIQGGMPCFIKENGCFSQIHTPYYNNF